MTGEPKIELVPLGEWWPPELGECLMEFPSNVVSLQKIGDRMFAILEGGQTVDITELLGDAKH